MCSVILEGNCVGRSSAIIGKELKGVSKVCSMIPRLLTLNVYCGFN